MLCLSLCCWIPFPTQAQQENTPEIQREIPKAETPEGWITSVEEAQKLAQKENKDIVVNFTGSDWCNWCVNLRKEVFAQAKWIEDSGKKYVLVHVDFPRRSKLSDEQKTYNENLMNRFGVEGFPTIFLLDAQGKAYAKTGYQEGGAEAYLLHLAELGKKKTERDNLMKEAEAAGEKKAEILDKLLTMLDEVEVGFAYMDLKEKVIALDAENKAGLFIKYASQLAQYYYEQANKEKSGAYLELVKKYDAKKAQELEMRFTLRSIPAQYFEQNKWDDARALIQKLLAQNPQGEVGQEAYYYAAVIEHHFTDKEKTIQYLEKARECAPNSPSAAYLLKILEKVKEQ